MAQNKCAPGQQTMFRPPAEATSVLIRVADGCPYNGCTFCAMYKKVAYRPYPWATQVQNIALSAQQNPTGRRIFLADGDALALPTDNLLAIMATIKDYFPHCTRINCYASGQSLGEKSSAELEKLRAMGLHTLYLGLESGSDQVLKLLNKNTTSAVMIEGAHKAQNTGLTMSVMIMIGAGGKSLSAEHVQATARVLGRMRPRHLACLRLIPVAGTVLAQQIKKQIFQPLSAQDSVQELLHLLIELPPWPCVFRANHSSNILPLAGRLPKDKPALIQDLQELLDAQCLDQNGPGFNSILG